MTLSRRSFFTGLATLIAAPAIVRAESLMKLAPTLIIPKPITFALDLGVGDDQTVIWQMANKSTFQFIPYEGPLYSLNEYSERILTPMINRLAQNVADAVMYGNSIAKYDLAGIRSIPLSELLIEAREGHQFA